jgi:hypothetical protein
VVIASRLPGASLLQLRADLARAEAALGDGAMHRPLALLAASHLALLGGDEARARHCLDESANAARAARQREWLWRALAARAELEEIGGQALLARRDREEALAVLEEIAAMLPRDLREVYWNDRRRRELRSRVQVPAIRPAREDSTQAPSSSGTSVLIAGLDSGATPLERRLARLLEINSELAAEHDLERLTARIVDHAVELLRAERGFLLMLQPDGSLSVHTSRSRVSADLHVDFSRSIAATVIETREPVVSVSAREDARMNDFPSVHEMMLQSVACVPIAARARQPLGALYIETRLRKGAHFEAELGT